MNQCESSSRHDDELQHCADRYILRLFEYILEITGGEAHAHTEHDDAEQCRDLRSEGLHHLRPENAEDACQHDADGHVFRTKTNDERKHRVAPLSRVQLHNCFGVGLGFMVQGSGFARGACRLLIACERGEAGEQIQRVQRGWGGA